jgi:hypothetical protein
VRGGSFVLGGAMVEPLLEPRNNRRDVGVQLTRLFERVQQLPVVDGSVT